MAELDIRSAQDQARKMAAYVQSFNGQKWGGVDESVDRQNLAVALDNLLETSAMLGNVADRLALTAPVATEQAQAVADLELVYAAFGIGNKARSMSTLTMCLSNVLRREKCLSAIERTFFMVPTEPDEEDGGEPGEECLLNWGQGPDNYVATFREALKAIAASPEAALEAMKVDKDAKTWAAYVAGIVETYLNGSPSPEVREKAIAGIIERRLWALPTAATPAAPSAADVAYETEHPAAKRMREAFEAKYGHASNLMRAANHWFNIRTEWNEAWNRDREKPVTEDDVAAAESAMLAALAQPAPVQVPVSRESLVLVGSGALQMVVNALRRDAEEGKLARGEMVDALLASMHAAPVQQDAPAPSMVGDTKGGA